VFRHITSRTRPRQRLWNIATDMAINCLIWQEAENAMKVAPGGYIDPDNIPLPLSGMTPGKFPHVYSPEKRVDRPPHKCEHDAKALAEYDDPPDVFSKREPTEKEKQAYILGKAVKDAPGHMTSEWYYDYLSKLVPELPDDEPIEIEIELGDGQGDCQGDGAAPAGDGQGKRRVRVRIGRGENGLDEHAIWADLPPELREKIETEIKALIERAVKDADSMSNGWGSIPATLAAEIRKSVSASVDWRRVTSNFIGSIARGETRRSVRARDRRYGLTHPGLVTGHTARLVIAIDQSGSVDDRMLAQFFAALEKHTKKVTVTILPFDSDCKIEEAWEWKRGTRPELKRVRCGGTDFSAPTRVINEHARAYGWEGAIFMTDGECSKPIPSVVKRAWIVPADRQLPTWLADELGIKMDDCMPHTDAWR